MTAPAPSTLDDMVAQLMGMGFDRPTAEREVRRQYPKVVASLVRAEENAENVREKEEQAYVVKLFRGFGCKVYTLSQARATKQSPGLPDLWVVAQWRRQQDSGGRIVGDGVEHGRAVAFWFETKRQVGGKLSPAQKEFRAECELAHVGHYVGDRRAAAKVLIDIGFARVGDGPCGIIPFHHA